MVLAFVGDSTMTRSRVRAGLSAPSSSSATWASTSSLAFLRPRGAAGGFVAGLAAAGALALRVVVFLTGAAFSAAAGVVFSGVVFLRGTRVFLYGLVSIR